MSIFKVTHVQVYRLSCYHVSHIYPCRSFKYFITPTNMLTDKQGDVQFIAKDAMSHLFHHSLTYHRRKMCEMFRKYYCPYRRDEEWMCPLSDEVADEFRLHLSWDLGVGVFHWSKAQVGSRILRRYKKLGMLKFLKEVIRNGSGLL